MIDASEYSGLFSMGLIVLSLLFIIYCCISTITKWFRVIVALGRMVIPVNKNKMVSSTRIYLRLCLIKHCNKPVRSPRCSSLVAKSFDSEEAADWKIVKIINFQLFKNNFASFCLETEHPRNFNLTLISARLSKYGTLLGWNDSDLYQLY